MRKSSNVMIREICKFHEVNDIELFTYGLNIFLRYILLGITSLTLLIILGNIKYILFYDLILILLRFHCGGFHAKNAITCFFISILSLVIFPEIAINLSFDPNFNNALMVLSAMFTLFIKPIQNAKKQTDAMFVEKINKRKKVITICLLLMYFVVKNVSILYANMIIWAFICNVISMFSQLKRREE